MKILFLCVANSARSQIAEGLAREYLTGAEVQSAGSRPGKLSLYAIKVMREIGINISTQYSKSIDDLPNEFIRSLDYIITLCSEEVCPVLPTKAKKLHWPMPDPFAASEEETVKRFREVRDAILRRLRETNF